jgi:type I restriction enzyme S subunit
MKGLMDTLVVRDHSWPSVRLDEICTLITDGTHQTPTYSEDGFTFLSAKNVVGGTIDWVRVKKIPSWLHKELHGRISPRKGDLLLAKNGTTGVAAIVDRDDVFDIYVSLALLRPGPQILPEYLWRVVNSPDAAKQFSGSLKGIGVPNLHLKDIRKTEIPLPPLAEQKRIAAILDAADALRTKRREALAQLEALLQSTFLTLFGDPVTNPMGWEMTALKKAAPAQPARLSALPHGDTWLLNLDQIESQSGKIHKKIMADASTAGSSTQAFDTGNVLYSKLRPYLNKVVCPDSYGVATTELVPLRPNPKLLDRQYLTNYLRSKSFVSWVSIQVAGAKMPRVSMKVFWDNEIPLPPLPLQQKFAAIVESVERQKAAQRAHLAALDALFAALQHRAFRGEL